MESSYLWEDSQPVEDSELVLDSLLAEDSMLADCSAPDDGALDDGDVHPHYGIPAEGAVQKDDGALKNGVDHSRDGVPTTGGVLQGDCALADGVLQLPHGVSVEGGIQQGDGALADGVIHPLGVQVVAEEGDVVLPALASGGHAFAEGVASDGGMHAKVHSPEVSASFSDDADLMSNCYGYTPGFPCSLCGGHGRGNTNCPRCARWGRLLADSSVHALERDDEELLAGTEGEEAGDIDASLLYAPDSMPEEESLPLPEQFSVPDETTKREFMKIYLPEFHE